MCGGEESLTGLAQRTSPAGKALIDGMEEMPFEHSCSRYNYASIGIAVVMGLE